MDIYYLNKNHTPELVLKFHATLHAADAAVPALQPKSSPLPPTFHQISNFGIEQSSKHEAQNLRIQPKCSNSFLSWKFRNPIITSLSSFLKALSYPKPTFIRRTRGRCLVTFWSEIFLLFTSSYDKHDVLHYNPYFVFVSFSSHFRK